MPIVALHYEREGSGYPLLLLHGGGLSSASHRALRSELARYFEVIAPDSRGHGKSPDDPEPMNYRVMALDVVALLDRLNIPTAHVVGFSDGAVIGLELAIAHPSRVGRLIALGGNYHPDGLTENTRREMELYENAKLKKMWLTEPNYTLQQLSTIRAPTLIAAGDRDVMELEHLTAMYRAIPRAELAIIPGATHFVLWEKAELAAEIFKNFLLPAAPEKSAEKKSRKSSKPLDAIVVGTGGAGSAALDHLARRGAQVLGLDRFPPGHARGSSHGDTRVIRLAYFENPDYVPLLRRAYELWDELSAFAGRDLIHRTGLIQVGPAGGDMVTALDACAKKYQLELEIFDGADLEERFPGFRPAEGDKVVYEKVGGYLDVEDCVVAHTARAVNAGARLVIGEAVQKIDAGEDSVVVTTDRAEYRAAKLVLCPGAWAVDLLAELRVPLKILRKSLFWYEPRSADYDRKNGAPVYLYQTPEGVFYGFPRIDARGMKVAQHSFGETVADPLAVDRTLRASERLHVESFLERHLPSAGGALTGHAVCMYTMTPDENFLLGVHPDHPRIALAAGLSGHGFKFTSVLGEILADLTLYGRTAMPVDFLSPRRFAAR